jgi:hypothetical protein
MNRYAYSANDPINKSDKNGHSVGPDEHDRAEFDSQKGIRDIETRKSEELKKEAALTAYDAVKGAFANFIPDRVNGIVASGKELLGQEPGTFGRVDQWYSYRNDVAAEAASGPQAIIWTALTFAGARLSGGAAAEGVGGLARFSPINPGSLAEDIANTVRSGTYTGRTLSEDTTLYRVIGDNGNPGGSFRTRTQPSGPLQSGIDSALDQSWGNTATTTITRTFPRGTQIFEGAAAPQGGLVGGGSQIYIPQPLP